MKIKDGFVLRHVMDSDIVMDVTGKFSGVVKLNATSAEIWSAAAEGMSEREIAARLSEEYGIRAEKAAGDVEKFCAAMREQGFFE